MQPSLTTPHLPHAVPIDAYGNGGFRFGGMSHRGSILCLPQGVFWAWPVLTATAVDASALALVFDAAATLDFVIIGTGRDFWQPPERLREQFRSLHVSCDVMQTSAAVRTYNVLVAEERRVAAALIAVD